MLAEMIFLFLRWTNQMTRTGANLQEGIPVHLFPSIESTDVSELNQSVEHKKHRIPKTSLGRNPQNSFPSIESMDINELNQSIEHKKHWIPKTFRCTFYNLDGTERDVDLIDYCPNNPNPGLRMKCAPNVSEKNDRKMIKDRLHTLLNAGESPVFEIGNSQLGPSQPIVIVDKRKGMSKSKRFSTSSKLKSPDNSRHAKECMCMKCDPDGKKKETTWPTDSKIGDYFGVVSRPYGSMKNLIPTQRATQRGIRSLPYSSAVRSKDELSDRERPQASLCQTERVTEASHNQRMVASQSPTSKIQDFSSHPHSADKSHDNGYSFLNDLENRAKSGELDRERGKKTSRDRNPFIEDEAGSSDTDEYE